VKLVRFQLRCAGCENIIFRWACEIVKILKRIPPLALVLTLAALLRIAWKLYTGYTFEDAFITFRYANNLAEGLGFVYNPGVRVLGTTTPLFALLMAGWELLFLGTPVVGSAVFGLAAGLTAIALVWALLDGLGLEKPLRLLTALLLALSDKLWVRDMGGMETPLVICVMAASLLLLASSRPGWAGALGGVLIWLRIDGVVWVGLLAAADGLISRRLPLKFLLSAALTFLPWAVFATLYFGSPLPHTVFAKQVAYATGMPPLLDRAAALLRGLTPFFLPYIPPQVVQWVGAATLLVAALGAAANRRRPWLLVLPAFCLAEFVRLVFTGATFESRYFAPLVWALIVLFGLGLGALWRLVSARARLPRRSGAFALLLYTVVSLSFSARLFPANRETQHFVFDSSLKLAGQWLERNTPPGATVFLEPLGYAGYYANRVMIDEVGLVSPRVVEWKKQGLDRYAMAAALAPDYIILHCDDAARAPVSFISKYARAVEFNPMGFDPAQPEISGQFLPNGKRVYAPANPRTACYQVWARLRQYSDANE
jgi:hypothetical protein